MKRTRSTGIFVHLKNHGICAVPPGLGRLLFPTQDFVLGFHISCLRHSGPSALINCALG